MLWDALQTIECCTKLAPWLMNHEQFSRMARHTNFSVRSTAASICMELAEFAPHNSISFSAKTSVLKQPLRRCEELLSLVLAN